MCFQIDLPAWVQRAGKTFITIRVDSGNHKITIDNVAHYYRNEVHSMSGCRSLGSIVGDWRPIDGLANFCLEYFKQTNIKQLRLVGRKHGLEPKF